LSSRASLWSRAALWMSLDMLSMKWATAPARASSLSSFSRRSRSPSYAACGSTTSVSPKTGNVQLC
jgi:hypothetical protein